MTLGCEIQNADTTIKVGEKIIPKYVCAEINKQFYIFKTFINNEYNFSDFLYSSCGVQYNRHEILDKGFVYYAGLCFMPSSDQLFKISARQGFRSPTIYEAYYEADTIKNNPDLKRERVDSYEINYQQTFNEFKLSSSIYYNEYRDLIFDSELFNEETQRVEQYSNSRLFSTAGIELNLDYHSLCGSETSLSCAYQDDRNNDLINFPEYLLNLTHTHPLTEHLEMEGLFHYISERKTRDVNHETSEFCSVDFVINAKYNNHLSFSLSGKNLFEDEFETPLGFFYEALTVSSRARTWIISIKSRF